ncbi:hypothetical protein JAAARDRAFT_208293 [Jaapia argillacea MUCL 33604]|uniref:Uncharacterized protein n=1 Tax=Jaapia argillacea MUCL 33604 TaxID=933084 RepID=A0A067Q0D4_9AGAM|nr:hypothetical protein JAAARDRAFT_208293 [Jaapia argillacea MUCL 33604]
MTTTPTLSPEITDKIIDYTASLCVYDDRPLRCCALTCRAWLPRSRFHRFKNVTLCKADVFRTFLNVLQQSPGVAEYIRSIVIQDPRERDDSGDPYLPQYMERWGPWVSENICDLPVSTFPKLETLRLSLTWERLDERTV